MIAKKPLCWIILALVVLPCLAGCRHSTPVTPKQMLDAAAEGKVALMKQYLNRGADVNCRGVDGLTPLYMAILRHLVVRSEPTDMEELLIASGADVDAVDVAGLTPLHHVAAQQSAALVRFLLDHGANPNARCQTGVTPLCGALMAWPYPRPQRSVVDLLLSAGADVRIGDKNGRTPLYWTVAQGDLGMVKTLLDHGADAKATDKLGSTPLHRVSISFQDAAVSIARTLVAHGADVNAATKIGCTPLHNAANSGSAPMVKYLLESGANVNAETEGETPLAIATRRNRTEIAAILRKHGAHR